MRFRKTVNICKGVKVNLSKSGMSCTVGVKGLSVNVGRNGVYLNTGIPGTGLYDRRKIAGGRSAQTKRRTEEIDVRDYELCLDEDGQVLILRRDGRRASDDEARRLRRTDWYAGESTALMAQLKAEMNAESDAFVSVHRHAQRVGPLGTPEDAAAVEQRIERWLRELTLPVEFSVQYEYSSAGTLMLDLDLPEIEDLPEQKAVEMTGGSVKPRAKSLRELREEYQTCVLGLAVFFASSMFALSSGIRQVLISGYTQRRDRKTGEMEDCYIFSIAFEREAFERTDVGNEDPCRFCDRFRSRINVLSTGEFKRIEPYSPEEFEKMF